MWPFNKKENTPEVDANDPIIKNHIQEAESGFLEDEDSIRDALMREYPSPESAIEDCRKGYVTEEQLRRRFTPEEMEYIHQACKLRDEDDTALPSGL